MRTQFSVAIAFLGALIFFGVCALLWSWLREYIRSTATAAGAEGANLRLEERKHELSGELERVKAELQVVSERQKARFQKDVSDYSIFVQRRHEAITSVYSDLVSSRMQAFSNFVRHAQRTANDDAPLSAIRDACERAQTSWRMHTLYLPKNVDTIAGEFIHAMWEFLDALENPDESRQTSQIGDARRAVVEKLSELRESSRSELQRSDAEE